MCMFFHQKPKPDSNCGKSQCLIINNNAQQRNRRVGKSSVSWTRALRRPAAVGITPSLPAVAVPIIPHHLTTGSSIEVVITMVSAAATPRLAVAVVGLSLLLRSGTGVNHAGAATRAAAPRTSCRSVVVVVVAAAAAPRAPCRRRRRCC